VIIDNIISFSLSQSDHIERLTPYLEYFFTIIMERGNHLFDFIELKFLRYSRK